MLSNVNAWYSEGDSIDGRCRYSYISMYSIVVETDALCAYDYKVMKFLLLLLYIVAVV